MSNGLKSRIVRLEDRRSARERPPYVYHVSNPPTAEESETIQRAKEAGRCFIIAPWPCATIEEWLATYGRPEMLQ
jgi:hypothetical protein